MVHPALSWVMVQLLEKGPPAMQHKELYQHILGLTSPWTVSEVKLDIPSEEIQVRVEHPAGTKFCCPEC
jgi:transposase